MRKLFEKLGLVKKRPEPKPEPRRRSPRVAVHLITGQTIVHRARFRRMNDNGSLSLFDSEDGGKIVADYAAGTWVSVSAGPRHIQPGKRKSNPQR